MAESAHEDLGAKLRRLRRESSVLRPTAGAAPPESGPVVAERVSAAASLPAHLVRRLERSHVDHPLAVRCTSGAPLRLDSTGGVLARREVFDGRHKHGAIELASALVAKSAAIVQTTRDQRLGTFDPARALYLDIEATGLSGGSGTYPFLVALGSWVEVGHTPRFEIWQGFMAGPTAEAALLAEVARRVRTAGAIVTFFGKSYDRHRLEDKMRHHRIAPPFDEVLHLDLYHPLDRLYRGSLPNGKLRTLEEALCCVERRDDLSGAHAPAAWFDFVAGRPHLLEEVFRHNLDDVLSLVVLTAHLGRVLDECDESGATLRGCGQHRAAALARLLVLEGDHVGALVWFERASERALGTWHTSATGSALYHDWARALERTGRPAEARRMYAEILGASCDDLIAARAGERLALLCARARETDEAERVGRAALTRLAGRRDGRATAVGARLTARLAGRRAT